MAKVLTLEQSLTQILAAPLPKAKLKFPDLWPKIMPFLLMLGMFVPKINKAIQSIVAAINSYLASKSAKAFDLVKIKALWLKVKPFLAMLDIFGKKVKAYVNAFIVFMDTFTAADDEEGDE